MSFKGGLWQSQINLNGSSNGSEETSLTLNTTALDNGGATAAGVDYFPSSAPLCIDVNEHYIAAGLSANPSLIVYDRITLKRVDLYNLPTLYDSIKSVSVYPDGSMIAYCINDTVPLVVIDGTGSPLQQVPDLSTYGGTKACSFSNDGNYLVVATNNSPYLVVLETSNWTVISGTPTLDNFALDCVFSPDGNYLALPGYSTDHLQIINMSDWSIIPNTPVLADGGNCAAFSNDGKYLAVGHRAGNGYSVINIADWSLVSGTIGVASYTGDAICFSDDSSVLFVGGGTAPELDAFDTESWALIKNNFEFSGGVEALASEGNSIFVSYDSGSYFDIIDVSGKSIMPVYPKITNAKSHAFSVNDAMLAVGRGGLYGPYLMVFYTKSLIKRNIAASIGSAINCLSFSPDGSCLAVGHSAAPFLTIFNTGDFSEIAHDLTLSASVTAVEFSKNGLMLAVGYEAAPYFSVLNTENWGAVSGTPSIPYNPHGFSFYMDDSNLAIAIDGRGAKNMEVYNTDTWTRDDTAPFFTDQANDVSVTSDGKILALVGEDAPYIKLWSTEDWSEVGTSVALPDEGWSCQFSPDDRYLLVGCQAAPYTLAFEVETWAEKPLNVNFDGTVWNVSFSHDGTRAAFSSDTNFELFHTPTK